MEWRVARLEEDSRELRKELRAIREDIGAFRLEVRDEFAKVRLEVGNEFAKFRLEVGEEFGKVRLEVGDEFGKVRLETREQLGQVREEIAYVKGRVSQLPSTWAMITAIMGSQIALLGMAIAAIRLLGRG